jgi:hypothetical protein
MRQLTRTVDDPENFFEVCRILDHVQKGFTSHLIISDDVTKALEILKALGDYCTRIDVFIYGGYAGPSQKWPSAITEIQFTRTRETDDRFYCLVKRVEAPTSPYYHGPRYVALLENPRLKEVPAWPPQFVGPVKDPADPLGQTYLIKSLILS